MMFSSAKSCKTLNCKTLQYLAKLRIVKLEKVAKLHLQKFQNSAELCESCFVKESERSAKSVKYEKNSAKLCANPYLQKNVQFSEFLLNS